MTWRVVVVVAACGGAAEVPVMPSNQTATAIPPAPDLVKLRSLLAPYDRDEFTKDAIENRACEKGTLGDYIAVLYREGKTSGGCGPFPTQRSAIGPPEDPAYWYCRIESTNNDSGEPWHYELRIRARKSDLVLDFATMTCPGTP